MKTVLHLTLLSACTLLNAQTVVIPQPFITESPAKLDQDRELRASSDALQWVAAFSQLRPSSSNKIEVVMTKDGEPITLSNIFKLEVSPSYRSPKGKTEKGNLLVATQKIENREFRVIIDPRQIRFIRETQP
jgi:hypothetical protein